MDEQDITACPRCKRPVEAKYYLRHPLGSVMPNIKCPCGYRGFPIQMKIKEYIEWKKEED